jgi:hypothetical protein
MALRLRLVIRPLRAEGSDGYGKPGTSAGIVDELRCTHQLMRWERRHGPALADDVARGRAPRESAAKCSIRNVQ